MTAETIKAKLTNLYKSNPQIHITLRFQSPRLVLENAPATIKGVYTHIFQVEEISRGIPQTHCLQYTDLMVGRIKIAELDL